MRADNECKYDMLQLFNMLRVRLTQPFTNDQSSHTVRFPRPKQEPSLSLSSPTPTLTSQSRICEQRRKKKKLYRFNTVSDIETSVLLYTKKSKKTN